MFPKVRIFRKIFVKCRERAGIKESSARLSCSDEIRIITARNHDSDFLFHVTYEEFEINGDACDFLNLLDNFVACRRRFSRTGDKHCKRNWFRCFVFRCFGCWCLLLWSGVAVPDELSVAGGAHADKAVMIIATAIRSARIFAFSFLIPFLQFFVFVLPNSLPSTAEKLRSIKELPKMRNEEHKKKTI